MKAFAALLDRLVYTPQRNGKLRLLVDYFRHAPDPDRGWALAALSDGLDLKGAKPALVRALVEERTDPVLFRWSYDYVGDLAETVALIWPERPGANRPPALGEVVEALRAAGRGEVPALLARWLDALDPTERWALLKLITGGLRVGVSARLAKTAVAAFGDRPVEEVEELWHGLAPPYGALFAWLEGRGAKPELGEAAAFRPLMLATPLEESEVEALPFEEYLAEWKWDGIRVQLVARGGETRLFSRTGDDIGGAFPDILEAVDFEATLDGELLVLRDGPEGGEVAPFNDLQQRLNRKTVTAKLLQRHPAHLRLYDILFEGREDLRSLPLLPRRARLEAFVAREKPRRMDLSPLVDFASMSELEALRAAARENGIEGLMLKRKDSPYLAGRPKGPWYKWKRDPLVLDCVLMYAQRGHGKRSSFYSDYTFGAWTPEDELVPVGKAYFGFTDEELKRLDKWVRDHTTERFGPVRAVEPGLVLEVAFDAVQRSTRHKSGLALRFPRVSRIRWDKPAHEADRVETLEALVEG
ncbi:DNA ligase-1 [Tistlia consotensis]|uniref:DNA ligase (ATP) n=1 Tax=Tistlia consotensis USBA 355 TaxID=560819 RepID=A0A1Y6CBU7_9PROT|nr:cisplatin damage response ATP-dependent DNA ligase [Tistlia consotensis]SMF53625.1 DNA ligase-1 [Tistlia consotensis USBA 355]SNR85792.1 DNA ligase-1 [Tistlia consotensis]